jgi:hypothetical protein
MAIILFIYIKKKISNWIRDFLLYSFYNIRGVSTFAKKVKIEKEAIPNVLHIHIKFIPDKSKY